MKTRTLLLIFLLSLSALAAPPYTLEQVLGAPFPSGLTASPKGDAIAWILDAQGVRNIWIATAPDYTGRAVTKFTEDDGQDLDDIAWNGSDTALVFTRGGSPNGRGENPNPANAPAGTRQEIWFAAVTGEVRKLGNGHAPAITRDGATVAWISGGQIWSAGTRGAVPPAQLVQARGSASDLTWSPDDQMLLFNSSRGDHSFIGVYDTKAKSLRYLDPSVDSDRAPVWSPDGRQIAFIRVPTAFDANTYGGLRTAEPWSIRTVGLAPGRSQQIWRGQPGTGSVFWPVSARNQLLWTATGRIVFPWENDGWMHLYSVPAEGGEALALTPGKFEVDTMSLGADGKTIVFSSNQDSPDMRHSWQVTAEKPGARRLIKSDEMEWAPVQLADARVALLRSDFRQQARASIVAPDGTLRDLAAGTMPSSFPAAAMIQPQAVTITATDGLALHGQLFLPAGAGKHPAVVFFHGGSRRQMLLGWHPSHYYNQAYAFNQYLASRGYVVLSVNYRSGTGYGWAFRQAEHFGPLGASDFHDVRGAGLFLKGRADVNAARIGVWGGSYGGYLAAMALDRAPDLFAAGVDLHGVHDWNLEFPDWAADVQRVAYASSPLSTMATWKAPVLVIQGDDDRSVVFAQSVQLIEALRKQGVPHEQIVFPDEGHEFLMHSHWLTAYHAAEEFLGKYLKP